MTKEFQTPEAKFCADLFDRVVSGGKLNPMFKVLASTVGNLIKMIESDEAGQAKVREIMDDICQRWPEVRAEVTVDGKTD